MQFERSDIRYRSATASLLRLFPLWEVKNAQEAFESEQEREEQAMEERNRKSKARDSSSLSDSFL